ncbi:hypothetical protein RQP46_001906 [Phenoliferia psychrophenolica]
MAFAWAGPDATVKTVQAFTMGSKSFFEDLGKASAADLSPFMGAFLYTVDIPAGATVAFEIFLSNNASVTSTTPFVTVLPGKTDACLRTNKGQLATASMASLAQELSSAQPSLFTGYISGYGGGAFPTATVATTTKLAPPTGSSTTQAANGTASQNGLSGSALAGIIASAILVSFLLLFFIFLLLRALRLL